MEQPRFQPRPVVALNLGAQHLDLAVADEGLVAATGVAVLQVQQMRHPQQPGAEQAADDQVVVVGDAQAGAVAADGLIGGAGPGARMVRQADQVAHRAPVGAGGARHVDDAAGDAIELAPVDEVAEAGVPAVPVRGQRLLVDLGRLAESETALRVAAEGVDQALQRIRRQFVVVVEFDQDRTPAARCSFALDGADIAAAARRTELAQPIVGQRRDPLGECGAIVSRVVDDDPLPVDVRLRQQRTVGPLDPVAGSAGGGEDGHQRRFAEIGRRNVDRLRQRIGRRQPAVQQRAGFDRLGGGKVQPAAALCQRHGEQQWEIDRRAADRHVHRRTRPGHRPRIGVVGMEHDREVRVAQTVRQGAQRLVSDGGIGTHAVREQVHRQRRRRQQREGPGGREQGRSRWQQDRPEVYVSPSRRRWQDSPKRAALSHGRRQIGDTTI